MKNIPAVELSVAGQMDCGYNSYKKNAQFIRIKLYRYLSTSLKIFNFLMICNSIVCDIIMLASWQIYIL